MNILKILVYIKSILESFMFLLFCHISYYIIRKELNKQLFNLDKNL